MNEKRKRNNYYIFCIIISLILLEITIYRAITTNITYDEAYTYMYYVSNNPFSVFANMFKEGTLANNHILNSFFISILSWLFKIKYNEFLIRLPNILFYIVYLFFGCKICSEYKYRYSAFGILALNYGANEFFGLGRGYGISCALVLGGIYYFKKYFKNDEKELLISYLYLLAACYANTVALIPFATIIVLSVFDLFKRKKLFSFIKKYFYILIPIVGSTLLIVKFHFTVTGEGMPLYGGKSSFYENVLKSIADTYGFPDFYINYTLNGIILILICIISRKIKIKDNNYLKVSAILLFVLLIVITKVTGSMWLTGRCLLPSMPILLISAIDILELIIINKKWLLQICICVPLFILFASNISVKYDRYWRGDYGIREKCYEVLQGKDNKEVISIKSNCTTQFYREKIILENNYDIFGEKELIKQ